MLTKLLLLMTLAEFFGDDSEDDDVYATIGYALYAIYLMVVVIILLNLLIAIMNSSINSVHAESINAWKFQRTTVL